MIPWAAIGVGAQVLSSLFGGKSDAEKAQDRKDKQQPFTSALWEPSKNPGLKTRMQLGPSNQINWEALAPYMTKEQMAYLEAAAPQYSGYVTPDKWGTAGSGTGGANGPGSGPGGTKTIEDVVGYNPFRPWQNPALYGK